jgi:hypothetical protein
MTRDQRYAVHAFIDELLDAARDKRPYDRTRAAARQRFYYFQELPKGAAAEMRQ